MGGLFPYREVMTLALCMKKSNQRVRLYLGAAAHDET
jgi:hypothetical protein